MGGSCLRMSREPGDTTLFVEAALAPLLPSDVGYPRVLATGREDSYAWVLSERLAGCNL